MRHQKRSALILSSCVALLLCAACSDPPGDAVAAAPDPDEAVMVLTSAARSLPLGVQIEAVGTAMANESVR